MWHNHVISSSVQILYCMYVYILYLFRKILIHLAPAFTNSLFPIFLLVHSSISVSFRYFGFIYYLFTI